jgi:hypothetical protein
MQPTLLPILIGVSLLSTIILVALVLILNKRIDRLTKGKKGDSLESIIHELLTEQKIQSDKHEQLVKNTKSIHGRVTGSIRGFAMHRFNAYEHTGGNQSFCCALLDENGRGMLLSSLYSRERSNIFAKPIHNFTCEFELTKEEKTVLEKAITSMR